jgi:hypothetical protein
MNRFDSPPNNEKCPLYEGPPYQGFTYHGGKEVFLHFVTDLPLGHPVRSGGIPHNEWTGWYISLFDHHEYIPLRQGKWKIIS